MNCNNILSCFVISLENEQLYTGSWLFDCFECVYQVVGEMI